MGNHREPFTLYTTGSPGGEEARPMLNLRDSTYYIYMKMDHVFRISISFEAYPNLWHLVKKISTSLDKGNACRIWLKVWTFNDYTTDVLISDGYSVHLLNFCLQMLFKILKGHLTRSIWEIYVYITWSYIQNVRCGLRLKNWTWQWY